METVALYVLARMSLELVLEDLDFVWEVLEFLVLMRLEFVVLDLV